MMTPEARFWSKVDRRGPAECWPWMGALDRWGYGRFKLGRKTLIAHRFAAAIGGGPVAADELALHDCDQPSCCNPAHIRPGTHAQNMADKAKRGRVRTDSRPWRLSADDIGRVAASKSPAERKQIAAELGIGDRWARYLVRRRTPSTTPPSSVVPRRNTRGVVLVAREDDPAVLPAR